MSSGRSQIQTMLQREAFRTPVNLSQNCILQVTLLLQFPWSQILFLISYSIRLQSLSEPFHFPPVPWHSHLNQQSEFPSPRENTPKPNGVVKDKRNQTRTGKKKEEKKTSSLQATLVSSIKHLRPAWHTPPPFSPHKADQPPTQPRSWACCCLLRCSLQRRWAFGGRKTHAHASPCPERAWRR